MAIVEPRFRLPVDVVLKKKASGGESIEINGLDVSLMTMGYKIEASPNRLKILCLYIPIASIKTVEE